MLEGRDFGKMRRGGKGREGVSKLVNVSIFAGGFGWKYRGEIGGRGGGEGSVKREGDK